MKDRYGRVQLLLSQHRHELAERDLRVMLADDPGDATAQSLLALCILHDRSRMVEATEMAQQAVGLAPDEPLGHYALAVSYLQRNRNEEAAAAIQESLRLDPHDADAFAVLSRSHLARQRYQPSLDAAVQGLAIDPDHLDCCNLRSISLERLGRGDEAIASAGETLRRDPDNPMSHAAHGHALLNAGRYKEAQVAFREALRLDPHQEMARIGLINALNNRSIFFRMVHRFYVLLSRMNSSAAFALIIGAWVLVQVLTRVVGPAVPFLQPFIYPIVALYVFFVVLTWIANPLFNSFLRFHPFGQHLLDRSQRWASNLIAPCLVLSVFGFLVACYFGNVILAFLAMAYWLGMAIPISATFLMPTQKRQLLVGAATVVIALVPVIGVIRSLSEQSPSPLYHSFAQFAYCLLAIQIASNVIAIKPVRH
jgi:tetratricopeptide (TPR) repeat protein